MRNTTSHHRDEMPGMGGMSRGGQPDPRSASGSMAQMPPSYSGSHDGRSSSGYAQQPPPPAYGSVVQPDHPLMYIPPPFVEGGFPSSALNRSTSGGGFNTITMNTSLNLSRGESFDLGLGSPGRLSRQTSEQGFAGAGQEQGQEQRQGSDNKSMSVPRTLSSGESGLGQGQGQWMRTLTAM